ncbi:Fic/DOC family protein [Halpernia humi]|uniref:Fic/DOC family protein n=1 Tax=Halpernia humi TaxID=493375 RepID=A0A1H6BH93_9FLAO|nr:Fic family protein [Halpernia humi]SEG59596.1 Fic/DOC family protein [Halpernia humi]
MKKFSEFENLEEIISVDEQKLSIDQFRPFSKEMEDKVFQKLKLDWNYNSNAIEGNQLSYGETIAFLNFGLTAKGKPFKDHLDIKGHNEAIQFMLQLIKENRPLSENDIKDLHKIILVEPYFSTTISPEGIDFQKEIKIGQYKTSPNHVKTISGDIHYYTNPEEVPFKMNELLEWLKEAEKDNLHPILLSAIFHHKFTAIHPFDDGNGRLARIISNFILLQHQYPVIVIKNKDKNQYYSALNIADNGIYKDLILLFVENISHSFNIYEKALAGENINEPDDLDKEIDLFTKEMNVQNIKTVDFQEDKDFLIETYIRGFFEYLFPKLNKIEQFFQNFYVNFNKKKYGFVNSNDFHSVAFNNLLKLNNSKAIYNFCFEEAVAGKYTLDFEIMFEFKNKTLEINVYKFYSETMFGLMKNEIYLKEILYSENPQPIFEEITKFIIKYLMDEIKNHTKDETSEA